MIRNNLRSIRQKIPSNIRMAAAISAANILSNDDLFERSKNIACYIATIEEFDCGPIIELIFKNHKKCYLPCINDNKILQFATYHPAVQLVPNKHNILEPGSKDIIPVNLLDLIIVPLVGFNVKGHRLGMGHGYYDRTFYNLTDPPFLLGLGYEQQCIEDLPVNNLDVCLNGILTEQRLSVIENN